MDVLEVNLNGRDAGRGDNVSEGDARLGISGRIQDDDVKVSFGFLDPPDQFALKIGLAEIYRCPASRCLFANHRFDIAQSRFAINLGFTGAEEIKVRAVEEENLHRGGRVGASGGCWRIVSRVLPSNQPPSPKAVQASEGT